MQSNWILSRGLSVAACVSSLKHQYTLDFVITYYNLWISFVVRPSSSGSNWSQGLNRCYSCNPQRVHKQPYLVSRVHLESQKPFAVRSEEKKLLWSYGLLRSQCTAVGIIGGLSSLDCHLSFDIIWGSPQFCCKNRPKNQLVYQFGRLYCLSHPYCGFSTGELTIIRGSPHIFSLEGWPML